MSCVTKGEVYVLTKTIPSKSAWCKRNGGKWNPVEKSWSFPLTRFPNSKDLETKYANAEYNAGSKADYYKKQRDTKKRLQQIQDQLETWRANLRPGISPEGNEIMVNYSGGLQFIGYKTDPDFRKLEALEMPCCRTTLIKYDKGGVLVYSGGYD